MLYVETKVVILIENNIDMFNTINLFALNNLLYKILYKY